MLMSGWAWRRRACILKLLERIRREVCIADTGKSAVEFGCSIAADLKA